MKCSFTYTNIHPYSSATLLGTYIHRVVELGTPSSPMPEGNDAPKKKADNDCISSTSTELQQSHFLSYLKLKTKESTKNI